MTKSVVSFRQAYLAPCSEYIICEEESALLTLSPIGGAEGFGEEDGQW